MMTASQHAAKWLEGKVALVTGGSRGIGATILLPMVPMNRYGETDKAASLAAFLASAQASYITEAAINIDGGMEAYPSILRGRICNGGRSAST